MLNIIRSAVAASSHRTKYYGLIQSSKNRDQIFCRQASSGDRQDADLGIVPPASSDLPDKKEAKSKKVINRTKIPQVNESDLVEKFISGSGPGGTRVNKSVNCCQIKHKPTGLVVKVHQSRSLEENRKIARQLMAQKLDNLYNGDESVDSQKKRLALHKMSVRESQAQKLRSMKEEYKRKIMNNNTDE